MTIDIEAAVTCDECRRAYSKLLFERDLLVADMAKWRARALAAGWKEAPKPEEVQA